MAEQLKLPHISSGELLRSAVREGAELGLRAKAVMDRGELISDDIMLELIEERLSRDDAKAGFILDGYPRNTAQAVALDGLLTQLDKPLNEALQIDVDMEQVIERIALRASREGRSDDSESVARKRMLIYAEQTAPVAEYYAVNGLLTRVLGMGSIEEVFHRIMAVLQIRSDS
jgi:adenylate kinase